MDAAVGPNFASIVAVARWREELVFACSQRVNTTLPLQAKAKAKAIKWALLLAKNLAVVVVSIETDSMVCHVLIPIFATHFLQVRLPCELNSCIIFYFILLSMAQAHATYWGKLRKCGLKGMGRFLLDLLHESSTCVLQSG